MLSRRTFLGTVGAGIAATSLEATAEDDGRQEEAGHRHHRVAFRSHAWHMGERFLVGYPVEGQWHRPPLEVVSAYVDQTPANDLSRKRAEEFGFTIYPTIAEALRCGGDKLAVDAVLIIGEHGDYPINEIGQKQYPRYEFFKQVADVFRKDGRAVPVFNDKHLSWKWEWAREMVDTARELRFPFLAGSSLPVTWRMPALDMPYGAEVEEVLCVAMGGVDSYDFHALEVIQCMAERRRGGETGVAAVQALRGDAVWKAMEAGSWTAGGWDPRLFEACLCRSQTLAQPPTFSHRHPTAGADPRVGQGAGRLPLRVRRRPEGDDAADERAGRRLHLRRPAQGPGRAALDAVLPAAQSQRRLLGRADVEGRGDVPDRQGALPDRTHAADHRPRGGGHAVAGGGAEAARDAASGRALRGAHGDRCLPKV